MKSHDLQGSMATQLSTSMVRRVRRRASALQPRRHRFALSVLVCGVTGLLLAPAAAGAAANTCPAAFPVSQLHSGQRASGLTVSQGEKPAAFSVQITGVLKDGIAPGIDMILASTDSAAIRAAGGVWAGMSGSPVYAADGRLIGAIAYGLAGASNVAGITPAAAMYENLTLGASASLVAAAPSGGMRPLPTPLGVSGLGASRLSAFKAGLERKGLTNTILYSSAASSASTAPASRVVPGGNFAGLISSGDATLGGVGTTTAVCGTKALAFGHPFTLGGSISAGANLASVLYVQKDNLFGPFKVANIGATVGTLDQDRLAAIRATLGAAPPATAVDSVITSSTTGFSRRGASSVYDARFVADATAIHLLANLDRVAQKIGEGSTTVGWNIQGTTGAGRQFTLARSNKYASLDDATFASIFELLDQVNTIQANPFTDVKFNTIHVTATTSEQYRAYRVTQLKVKQGGVFVPVAAGSVVTAPANSRLALQVVLTPYRDRGRAQTLSMSLNVPNAAGSGGTLQVGSPAESGDAPGTPPASFNDLIASLAGAPVNNSVRARLEVDGATPPPTRVDQVTTVDQVVDGSIAVGVQIT